jgi:hypothetical protein
MLLSGVDFSRRKKPTLLAGGLKNLNMRQVSTLKSERSATMGHILLPSDIVVAAAAAIRPLFLFYLVSSPSRHNKSLFERFPKSFALRPELFEDDSPKPLF